MRYIVKIAYLIITFLVSRIAICGNEPNKFKNDSLTYSTYKQISKNQLVNMIDSLLEKDIITPDEIAKIKYFSSLLKYKKVATYETEYDDLSNLHFYSEKEEKILFPPFPLDSMPRTFNLQLENFSTKNYTNPFNGVITSYYGWRDKRMHKGIDIDLNKGEPVVAAFDGKVRIAQKNKGGFGNLVIIMHANGLETVYAHLSKIKVKEGQVVLSGQTIGLGGNTGRSRGSHLHFETRYKGHAINPLHFISYNDNKLHFQFLTLQVNKKGITAFPTNAELHTVKKGESWNKIALSYQTTVSKLLLLNGSAKRYYLRPGQQLRVN